MRLVLRGPFRASVGNGYLGIGIGSWNGEMDEGIEGRSGVTLAGSNSVE
jgi:hypothetical protein